MRDGRDDLRPPDLNEADLLAMDKQGSKIPRGW